MQRFADLAETSAGDEWDREYDLLKEEWLAAYIGAFVEIALVRGWRSEDAVTWPVGIDEEAFINAYEHDWCPRRSAEADVIASEAPPC